MKCDLNVGFYWDNINEIIVDWEKRTPCQNEAVKIYTWDTLKSKPKTYLCHEHFSVFEKFAGTLEDVETQASNSG